MWGLNEWKKRLSDSENTHEQQQQNTNLPTLNAEYRFAPNKQSVFIVYLLSIIYGEKYNYRVLLPFKGEKK